jgi:hypothetical protein
LLRKSSTYKVPVTSVPDAPDGVIVTLTVAVWPGLITIGENDTAGFAVKAWLREAAPPAAARRPRRAARALEALPILPRCDPQCSLKNPAH